ncbi:biopolymer transporter ExbD, partial [Meiothermus sp. PNK-Is4]
MRRRAGLGRRTLEPVEFNFAPMVDVVLILVIFFMLAANLNRPDRAFAVDLPQASTAQAIPQAPLVIALSRNGQVALNGQVVSPAAL